MGREYFGKYKIEKPDPVKEMLAENKAKQQAKEALQWLSYESELEEQQEIAWRRKQATPEYKAAKEAHMQKRYEAARQYFIEKGMITPRIDEPASDNALTPDMQHNFSQALGHDISGVTIHTDTEAAELAESLNARAVTQGKDIYFNKGEYNPTTQQGQELLAHELTHTTEGDHFVYLQEKDDQKQEEPAFSYSFDMARGCIFAKVIGGGDKVNLYQLSKAFYGSGGYFLDIAFDNKIKRPYYLHKGDIIKLPYIERLTQLEQHVYSTKVMQILAPALLGSNQETSDFDTIPNMQRIELIPQIPKYEYYGNWQDWIKAVDNAIINLGNGCIDIVNGVASEGKYIYNHGIVNYSKGVFYSFKATGQNISKAIRNEIDYIEKNSKEQIAKDTLNGFKDPKTWEQYVTVLAAIAVTKKMPGAPGKIEVPKGFKLPNSEMIGRSVGAMSRAERLAIKLKLNINSETARQVLNSLDDKVIDFIGKYRKGNIKGRIPGEVLNMTVEEALQHSTTVRKLLIDSRFVK